MSTPKPTTTAAERFEVFQAHHGPLESPLADRILGTLFERTINRFFEYPQSVSLSEFVQDTFKHKAPDFLAILELAADWSADPMKAAGRLLRGELDAKAQAEARTRKREEEAALAAAIRTKADAFLEEMKKNVPAVAV